MNVTLARGDVGSGESVGKWRRRMCARKLRTTARDPDAPSTTAKTTPTQTRPSPSLTLFSLFPFGFACGPALLKRERLEPIPKGLRRRHSVPTFVFEQFRVFERAHEFQDAVPAHHPVRASVHVQGPDAAAPRRTIRRRARSSAADGSIGSNPPMRTANSIVSASSGMRVRARAAVDAP